MYFSRFDRLYRDRNEEAPLCNKCSQPMEAEPDVDIDEETGRPYISGSSTICNNPDCPE
jgi:hypothetical protein